MPMAGTRGATERNGLIAAGLAKKPDVPGLHPTKHLEPSGEKLESVIGQILVVRLGGGDGRGSPPRLDAMSLAGRFGSARGSRLVVTHSRRSGPRRRLSAPGKTQAPDEAFAFRVLVIVLREEQWQTPGRRLTSIRSLRSPDEPGKYHQDCQDDSPDQTLLRKKLKAGADPLHTPIRPAKPNRHGTDRFELPARGGNMAFPEGNVTLRFANVGLERAIPMPSLFTVVSSVRGTGPSPDRESERSANGATPAIRRLQVNTSLSTANSWRCRRGMWL
jgi:hypothetical protein